MESRHAADKPKENRTLVDSVFFFATPLGIKKRVMEIP